MQTLIIFQRSFKWRLQNPITIALTLIPPLFWLVLYSSIFANSIQGNSTAFILSGILVLVIFSSSGSSGEMNYYSKMSGSFYRILISPIRRSAIVMGHILDAAALSLIEISILLLVSLLMSVRIASGPGGLILIFVLLLCTIFFVAALSYLISLLLPEVNAFHTMMNTFVLPVFFLSTALISIDEIPVELQPIVSANPFTHVINSLRNLILSPTIDWQQFALAAVVMLLPGLLLFLLATRRLQQDQARFL